MSRRSRLFLFIALSVSVIAYLDNRIMAYDKRFYYGKDDGVFVRFESICLLSSILFLMLGRWNWFLRVFLGFVSGFVSSLLAIIFVSTIFDNPHDGLIFHILACLIFIGLFYLMDKLLRKKKTEGI